MGSRPAIVKAIFNNLIDRQRSYGIHLEKNIGLFLFRSVQEKKSKSSSASILKYVSALVPDIPRYFLKALCI
jgi:hypothetical protein